MARSTPAQNPRCLASKILLGFIELGSPTQLWFSVPTCRRGWWVSFAVATLEACPGRERRSAVADPRYRTTMAHHASGLSLVELWRDSRPFLYSFVTVSSRFNTTFDTMVHAARSATSVEAPEYPFTSSPAAFVSSRHLSSSARWTVR